MNIFVLDSTPRKAAQYHLDKHCVKMILESAQLLSTAHRVLDGREVIDTSTGRKRKRWILTDNRDSIFYSATHINHPCAKWVRESSENYRWLYSLFVELCKEYTHRYGKVHACEVKLRQVLSKTPINIRRGDLTPFAQAMPEKYRSANPVLAYRQYYIHEKHRFAKWSNRECPAWFSQM